MPAFMAFATGVVNAVALITATAMPFAFAEIAAFVALTICGTLELADPVQVGLGMPSSAAASSNPYWVGTKNGLVVTWLMKANFHAGVLGKLPAVFLAAVAVLLEELHAASRADAAAVALMSPVPLSSLRRLGPSFMFSVSTASSTLGSTFLIAILQKSSVRQGSAPRGAYDPGPTWRAAPASSPWGRPGKRLSRAVRAPHPSRWAPDRGSPPLNC